MFKLNNALYALKVDHITLPWKHTSLVIVRFFQKALNLSREEIFAAVNTSADSEKRNEYQISSI